MKRLFLICILLWLQTTLAVPLLPGARVYHLKNIICSANDASTPITGKIVNFVPTDPLYVTNPLTVPNSFPEKITASAEYSVSPPLSKSGYEIWTKSIKYVNKKGKGCLIQFAWNPATQSADIGLTSLNYDFWNNCKIGDDWGKGTNIIFDNSKN